MVHEMKLNDNPFKKIKAGTKKIEMRLYDEKRKKINIGDIIEFTSRETGEVIKAKVLNLHIVKSFEELYNMFDKVLLGYDKLEEACYTDMEQYYSKDEIDACGVVGIEIELIK